MILEEADALRHAIVSLASKTPPDQSWVILEESTIEIESAWIFFYDAREFIETGNIIHSLAGNGPIFVNKNSGIVDFFGSLPSVDALINSYESD